MQLDEIVSHRHMVRSYLEQPIAPEVLEHVLTTALRAPSAGFTQGVDFVVLEGPEQTGSFFAATSDPEFLAEPGVYAGLLRAPVIVLPLCDPAAYVSRYAEEDKSGSSLSGLPASSWPVPYWLVDSSFAVMLLLLAATDAGLGALFFRLQREPAELLAALGAPPGQQVVGAVALGYEEPAETASDLRPAGSPSRRPRRPPDSAIHHGRW